MSKNVAVFVDVANIFYAAKAAGVDIDYVTLLKSAVAGRDFVRAYAYTGLDPENDNQRQFHAFLSRSGYKVVSKDIRKYGDGRIKANLDIELVVDLMRTARNLDIAVVVSGDGDFAPAIRAVQQQGIRVEVISFRGNTSSDLIDVADQFIDIAQIARVDKESARSGRRVATEGDLSMTEVPEKETEGAPRRRRGGRAAREQEREDRFAVADAGAAAGGMTVLPGERLSRVGAGANGEAEDSAEAEVGAGPAEAGIAGEDLTLDGHRRRRRRGGRGRGRGRRPELEGLPAEELASSVEEDEDFEAVMPPPPPHQAFGSVWDSQLGVPGGPASAVPSAGPVIESFEPDEDEDDLEEPEIPEYLLAERRQRGGSHVGRGRPRGRGAYQAALDRERYGRGSSAPSSGGFGGNRIAPPPRQDRGRGGRPQRPPDRPRLDRPMQQRPPERQSFQTAPGSDPWSEVPPDLEEMLRAELARKQTSTPEATRGAPGSSVPAEAVTAAAEAPAPARRTRTRKAVSPDTTGESAATAAAPETDVKPKRTTRARTTKATAEKSAAVEPAPTDAVPTDTEVAAKPRRRTKSTPKTDSATE